MKLRIAAAMIVLSVLAAPAKDFVNPEQILYERVPGFFGPNILEWEQKSRSGAEPLVTATIDAPSGLRIRWLGAAGFELSDNETTILIDPFVSRPTILQMLRVEVDTEAVEKYVIEPLMRSGGLSRLKAILVSHTHHDHVQDVPYILAKFPKAQNRPLVAGDENLLCVLKGHNGRAAQIPWVKGIDSLSSGPKKIFKFNEKKKLHPSPSERLGIRVGTFGRFSITAYVSEHGLYDDLDVTLDGRVRGKAPFGGLGYLAYLHSSMTYLIEYNAGSGVSGEPKRPLRFFFSDSPRFLHPDPVSREVGESGGVDILLQGIAGRKKENGIPAKIGGFKPKYFIPTHYDNFFVPFYQFRTFEFEINAPTDNSRLQEFVDTFCMADADCPKLRLVKMLYYYSLEELLNRSN